MKLVLLGAPGSGKGVQSVMLSERFGVRRVCLGDILREEVKKDTSLGREIKQYMDKGLLVPDEVVSSVVKENLGDGGFILDGYPRTLSQAEKLDEILKEKGICLDAAIYLDVDENTVVRRLTARRVCKECGKIYNLQTMPPKKEGICDECGGKLIVRSDDREEVVRKRWKVFMESNAPILAFYQQRKKLIKVNAEGDKKVVFSRIEKELEFLEEDTTS